MRIYDITYNLAEDAVSVEVVPNKLTLKKDAEVYFFTKKVSSKDELKQTLAAVKRRGPWELSASIKAPNVEAALEMCGELGTPEGKKRKAASPEAGAHVIGCELTSGAVEEVEEETFRFMEEVVGWSQDLP